MDSKFELCDCWDEYSDETKEKARQIIKTFAEKGLSICDAKEVLHACEIYIEVNGKVAMPG